jgi:ABC-type polysaccharide/polyol phosphate transport system ATPase subunit
MLQSLIAFENVSKSFTRHTGQRLLRSHLTRWFRGLPTEAFHALKNVTFQVEHGEAIAVLGSNGAGKSTLLSLVAGLAKPDRGAVRVNGRIAALLELGSGFHHDLTGAENIHLNAALLGLTARRTRELYDEIVAFSGVGEFINEPLRTYSSGMVMRLAFSVAVHLDPEVLLIDEVLVVGDQEFQAKCFEKLRELRQRGKTFVCVSHAFDIVQQLCDRALWLDHGELVMNGPCPRVLAAYKAGIPHAPIYTTAPASNTGRGTGC